MCLFIETLRIDGGEVCRIDYHNERLNRTRTAFGYGSAPIDLADCLRDFPREGIFKCRVLYGHEIEEITYTPYVMRPVRSLRAVHADTVDYAYKSADRSELDGLFARRGGADDTLIVKNGRLTDTTIANIALYDGTGWYTPASPLLEGIQRADLLRRGVVRKREINAENIWAYSEIMLFNAMIEFGELRLPVDRQHILL